MTPIKLIPLNKNKVEIWSNGAENCAVHLTYDIGDYLDAWPGAKPTVAYERADEEKYAHAWELHENVLHIPLLTVDTAKAGLSRCMITLHSGDGRANTVVFSGRITKGIDSIGETPEEPLKGIIEQINEAVVRCETAAEGITLNVLEQLRKV